MKSKYPHILKLVTKLIFNKTQDLKDIEKTRCDSDKVMINVASSHNSVNILLNSAIINDPKTKDIGYLFFLFCRQGY